MYNVIDLKQIDLTGKPIERETELVILPEALEHDDILAVSDAQISVTARKGGVAGEYIVEGSFRFTADLGCARCLEPVPFANESEFAVTFRPHPEMGAAIDEEPEIEIGEGDLDVEYYAEPQVSLEQLAVEQIELGLPMKMVCSESCLGLCPRCGANRNRGTCACAEEIVDERWQGLAGLRDQMKKNEH